MDLLLELLYYIILYIIIIIIIYLFLIKNIIKIHIILEYMIFLYKTLLNFEEDNNLYKILACIPSKKSEPFELKNNLKIDSKAYLL